VLTKQDLEHYNVDALMATIPHAEEQSDHWSYHTGRAQAQLDSIGWLGDAADAARLRAQGNTSTALIARDVTASAASTASAAGTYLTQLHSAAMFAMEQAQLWEYDIDDSLHVFDPRQGTYMNPGVENWREAHAMNFEVDLKAAASALVAADTQVSLEMTAHTLALHSIKFPHTAGRPVTGGIQMVDNTYELDPLTGQPKTWTKLDHPLEDCSGVRVSGDILSILGGVAGSFPPAVTTPGGWLAIGNGIRGIWDIGQCKGP